MMTKVRATTKAPPSPRGGKISLEPKRDPEPAVELVGKDKPITFFSRYRGDQLVMEPARVNQVGQNKWVTIPAKEIAFHDRAFVTNNPDKIDFIRSHPRYGRELFESGVKAHQERILAIDDSGRILALEHEGKLARLMETRRAQGLNE